MRTVAATRYVTPLREGGSLPAIVEGEDDGLYVVKFRGAGQGTKALVAEVIAGELARAAGLRVPELVRLEISAALGRNEPDEEIRDLLKGSVGLNVGLDYLPGSVTFDPVADAPPAPAEASEVVFFDALVTNVDRTARNANLLSLARAALAHRSRCVAVLPPRLAGDAGSGADAVPRGEGPRPLALGR